MPKSLNTHLKSLRSLSSATTAYGSTNFCSLNKSKICACFSTDCDHKSQFFLQFYSLFLFWLINVCKFGEMCRNNRRKMMSNRHTTILKRVLRSMKKKLKRMKQRLKDARKQIDLNFICICIVYFTLLILIRLYETWHTHWLWLWFDLRFALVTLLSFFFFFFYFIAWYVKLDENSSTNSRRALRVCSCSGFECPRLDATRLVYAYLR